MSLKKLIGGTIPEPKQPEPPPLTDEEIAARDRKAKKDIRAQRQKAAREWDEWRAKRNG